MINYCIFHETDNYAYVLDILQKSKLIVDNLALTDIDQTLGNVKFQSCTEAGSADDCMFYRVNRRLHNDFSWKETKLASFIRV